MSVIFSKDGVDFIQSSNNQLTAQIGSQTLEPSQIRFGFEKNNHDELIQKIQSSTDLYFEVEPSKKNPARVWVFEANKKSKPFIRSALECRKKDPKETLRNLKEALIQDKQNKQLQNAVIKMQGKVFYFWAMEEANEILSEEKLKKFKQILNAYKSEEGFYSMLQEYLDCYTFEKYKSRHHCLAALIYEFEKDYPSAAGHYLHLAESRSADPVVCIEKAIKILGKVKRNNFHLAHFFEKLDRELLLEIREESSDFDKIQRWIDQKDAIRMSFEACLQQLRQLGRNEASTCFISFSIGEGEVDNWLRNVLVPDIDRLGIEPIFCFRQLRPGDEIMNFQAQIRHTDSVILVCTPRSKAKCNDKTTGIAQELGLAINRLGDKDLKGPIFPIIAKGTRAASVPSEYLETALATKTSEGLGSYFDNIFRLFATLVGAEDNRYSEVKSEFMKEVIKIHKGNIDQEALIKWREDRESKVLKIFKEKERVNQEKISKGS